MSASNYIKGIGGGAVGGAGLGTAIGGPGIGTGIGALLGGLFGGLSTHDTQQAGDNQKAAMQQAIAAAQASGKRQAGFSMGVERLGQSYVSPMDDLYKHLYGGNAPGVSTPDEQRQQDMTRIGLRNGDGVDGHTAMMGHPQGPGSTPFVPATGATPGMPGWKGPDGRVQPPPTPPPAPPVPGRGAPPAFKPQGFR